ncbi:unnamed protein product [Cylicostephanus goldi]|uniref:Galactokinase N-terminal domain-containing protein n=1 Tax=Cylicostephanus goldi TaxID=71465 RepID=A0A3P6SPV5_CYLGO|nr:unnamed protein product [Cylicostephanus goldi]
MADYSIGERILEERLYENETSRPPEPDHVINLKHGVIREAYELFLTHFGANSMDIQELKAAVAPGRVNLIGDHIDYCDGFVLPMVGEHIYDMVMLTSKLVIVLTISTYCFR